MTKITPPSATDQAHRRALMDYCTQHTDPSVRPTFVTFYSHFERWNSNYFADLGNDRCNLAILGMQWTIDQVEEHIFAHAQALAVKLDQPLTTLNGSPVA